MQNDKTQFFRVYPRAGATFMQQTTIQLTSTEIFQALTALEAQEEKGVLDPAPCTVCGKN